MAEFRVSYATNFDRLYRYALRYLRSEDEAADVIQEVFLAHWDGGKLLHLNVLYAMTRNRCLNVLKHRSVEDRHEDRVPIPAVPRTPDDLLAEREIEAAIQAAVDTLSPQQQRVMQLRWFEHLSHAAIARQMGIAEKTVAVHVGRALAHLRERLPHLLDAEAPVSPPSDQR